MFICKWPLGLAASVQLWSAASAAESQNDSLVTQVIDVSSNRNTAHPEPVEGLLSFADQKIGPLRQAQGERDLEVLIHNGSSYLTADRPDEVVVTGSRIETRLSETPTAIGRVGSEELKRDKPKTMGDIINRIPGVSWNDLGNEQHSMGIRQPNSTNAVYQYLEDGIPIRPLGVFNHNSLNELNMSAADSVEVVKGPSSSLYGSNAVGGAINLLTAKPTQALYAHAGIRYDSINGFKRYDTALSDSFGNYGFKISHYSSRRDHDNWQEYSYGDKDSVTLRMDYKLSSLASLRATYGFSDLDTAMTGSVFEGDFNNNPGHSINTFTYRRDKAQRATLATDLSWSAESMTTVTAFWRDNNHGQLPSYTITGCSGTSCRGTINNNHVDSLGIDVKHVQSFAWWSTRLIGGIYLDSSENNYVSDNLAITRTLAGTATDQYVSYSISSATNPLGVRDYKATISNYAPFVQVELTPVNSLRVVVGWRYDSIKYDFTNHLTPGINYGAPDEQRTFAHFSPKVGATYAFADNFSMYANASEGFTAPDVSQLYGKTAIPDLKPATYQSYELGARYSLLDGALKFDTAIYRLEGEDTIVSFTPIVGSSFNQNAGETLSRGVELGVTLDWKRVDARLGGSYAEHEYVHYAISTAPDRVYDGHDMPQAPTSFNAEVGYRIVSGVRIAVEAIRQSSFWMNDQNTVHYNGHTLINARLNAEFAKHWQTFVQGRNLTNQRFADSASSSYNGFVPQTQAQMDTQNQYTPGAPRSVMLGVTYTFGAK